MKEVKYYYEVCGNDLESLIIKKRHNGRKITVLSLQCVILTRQQIFTVGLALKITSHKVNEMFIIFCLLTLSSL